MVGTSNNKLLTTLFASKLGAILNTINIVLVRLYCQGSRKTTMVMGQKSQLKFSNAPLLYIAHCLRHPPRTHCLSLPRRPLTVRQDLSSTSFLVRSRQFYEGNKNGLLPFHARQLKRKSNL